MSHCPREHFVPDLKKYTGEALLGYQVHKSETDDGWKYRAYGVRKANHVRKHTGKTKSTHITWEVKLYVRFAWASPRILFFLLLTPVTVQPLSIFHFSHSFAFISSDPFIPASFFFFVFQLWFFLWVCLTSFHARLLASISLISALFQPPRRCLYRSRLLSPSLFPVTALFFVLFFCSHLRVRLCSLSLSSFHPFYIPPFKVSSLFTVC